MTNHMDYVRDLIEQKGKQITFSKQRYFLRNDKFRSTQTHHCQTRSSHSITKLFLSKKGKSADRNLSRSKLSAQLVLQKKYTN